MKAFTEIKVTALVQQLIHVTMTECQNYDATVFTGISDKQTKIGFAKNHLIPVRKVDCVKIIVL